MRRPQYRLPERDTYLLEPPVWRPRMTDTTHKYAPYVLRLAAGVDVGSEAQQSLSINHLENDLG